MQHENHMYCICLKGGVIPLECASHHSVYSHDHERRWQQWWREEHSLQPVSEALNTSTHAVDSAQSKVLQLSKPWHTEEALAAAHTHSINEGHEVGHGKCQSYNNRITKCCKITLQTVLSSHNTPLLFFFFLFIPHIQCHPVSLSKAPIKAALLVPSSPVSCCQLHDPGL